MSKLYIKGTSKKPEDMTVLLNNQPLTRLQSLKLELDEHGKSVVHVSFYPSSIEVNTNVEVKEAEAKSKKVAKKKKGG